MDKLTSKQISEWQAYDRLDPIGEWRADFRMAYLCTIVTNIARKIYGEKGVKMTAPLDFMPEWGKEDSEEPVVQKRQTTEEMRQLMLGITRIQNKKVKRKKRTIPPKKKR